MNLTIENWRPVKGYENLYEASSEGSIRPIKPRFKTSPVLKPGDNGSGHKIVVLCKDGNKQSCQVSRLVYEAFYGSIPEGHEIDHIDENTANNRLSNLQAIPHHRNIVRGTAVERMAYEHRKPVKAFLNNSEVAHFASIKEAAATVGVSASSIGRCAAGKAKHAAGYTWEYADHIYAKPKKIYEL